MTILQDYSDPFDTREETHSQVQEEQRDKNEGYMEPFEAQKVLAVEMEGIKDLPWPPPVGQLDGSTHPPDAEKHLLLQSTSSRDAPPGLQNASPSTPDSSASSCPLEVNSAATVKSPAPACLEGKSAPCWLSPEAGVAFGEYVNPALPLESQAWYHGTLSRVDAESLLRLCREASYLVRNSESSHDAFSLSLKSSQGFLHMKLLQTEDNKFVLGQHSPPFSNIPEVIHHYASHKLPIQGAEHMSLLYPVSTQPSNCLAAEP
ncbi:SH2 domain-containing adapter protein F [Protobothrops mucrosquamatus]|uniref:SH2 domain-containing adapter protein F n=1 Tax=Protobothrops mucrosquamatus TaxID=103944 RepID=UPI0010FB0EC6|nr:SH2 domain-containing adapter protein F [Protobothrops mucrosquamatus]